MLRERELKKLEPLLEGGGPNDQGECSMHCPYHGDSQRSASVNVEKGLWNCFGCGASGEVIDLLLDIKNWEIPERNGSGRPRNGYRAGGGLKPEDITEAKLDGWHQALMSNKEALSALRTKRGLTVKTLKRYQIGYDGRYYTIPIRDLYGEIVNVRRYDINPGDRRKIFSVAGMGQPSLFPVDQLDNDAIVICEGEWDALLSIQNGVPAITRTGTADHWNVSWSDLFRGKRVYPCHDMDSKGQKANADITEFLKKRAASVTVVSLPYEVTDDHGKDITDFYMEGGDRSDFLDLVRSGVRTKTVATQTTGPEPEIAPISLIDSFDSSLSETPLLIHATITGKKMPPYSIPKNLSLLCDLKNGKKCEKCPMATVHAGTYAFEIPADSPLILSMIGQSSDKVREIIRKDLRIPVCNRLEIERVESRTVEEIYVRPSIDEVPNSDGQDFTHRKVISTTTHDLMNNQTVDLIGTIRANPNNQANEFQSWKVSKPENTLDTFKLTPEIREELSVFMTEGDPLERMYEIADDLSKHVTKIRHRDDMHVFMDIVLHSCMRFNFGDDVGIKGWIDAVIIGDTRTGKSECASKLLGEYGMGELISCESATYAGVFGGLDRTPDGSWVIKWGAIPINDGRAVVLDEVSGLSIEQIAQMSNLRSSGIAEMTKISRERAFARTRLLWLANPRNARMNEFTFGVQALQPLIGNNEDLARFDMAMGAFSDEVGASEINAQIPEPEDREFPQSALRNLLRWAWTRKPADIVFARGALKECRDAATDLGSKYLAVPPLIEGGDARKKIARIAIAIAARTFSCDARGRVVVEKRHVEAAVRFLDIIYGNQSFGYSILSQRRQVRQAETVRNMDHIMEVIGNYENLQEFLLHTPIFDRGAMEGVMNMSREASNSLVSHLWKEKALIYDGGAVKLDPEVIKYMRGFIR